MTKLREQGTGLTPKIPKIVISGEDADKSTKEITEQLNEGLGEIESREARLEADLDNYKQRISLGSTCGIT